MNKYKEEFFNALMWAQAVENLVRDCILLCYDIKSSKLQGIVVFNPPKDKIKSIKRKMGLGSLCNELLIHIDNAELCKRISEFSESRNYLAHMGAAEYMNGILVDPEEDIFKDKFKEYQEIKTEAGEIYGDLLELHTDLENELREIKKG